MDTNIFIENTNKAMLWELLEDSFSNIENDDYNNFKDFFDKHVNNINNELGNKGIDTLIEKNKYFIQDTLNLIKNKLWKTKYTKQVYTSKDIEDNKKNEFEQRFLERQKEFTNLINLSKPNDISFEDNLDKPITNMEEILKQRELERNQSIKFYTNDIPNNTQSLSHESDENNFRKINILDDEQPKKKVTFNSIIDNIEIDEKNNDNIDNTIDIKLELKKMNEEMTVLQRMIIENSELLKQYINKSN